MNTITALWIAAIAAVGPANAGVKSAAKESVSDPVVQNCLVTMLDEAQVPGREAGVLVALEAKEGMQVKAGQFLARIDDSEPAAQKRVKMKEHAVAVEKSSNDVNVRYAKKATEVSKEIYEMNLTASKSVGGAISKAELNKLRLEWEKSALQIEQADHERRSDALTAGGKEAEVAAAEDAIQRRQITSPIDGIVVKLNRHVGEWVAPGDPVLRIVRVDRLRIEAFLTSNEFSPPEVDGKPVTVEVELARGRKEKFPGKVVFVSPLVEAGGEYRVLADVVNRAEDGHYLLRPGQLATMTIRLH